MKFNETKVEYATHALSLYYGECPYKCTYCYVYHKFTKRGYQWATGKYRINPKAIELAEKADTKGVDCLFISFTGDPLPHYPDSLQYLAKIITILQSRNIKKIMVLTKNSYISKITEHIKPTPNLYLGMTVSTHVSNDRQRYIYEKFASSTRSRYLALLKLKEAGFNTWVSAEPLLPRTQIHALLKDLIVLRVNEIYVGKANYIKKMEKALNWGFVAHTANSFKERYTEPKIFLKEELKRYLDQNLLKHTTAKAKAEERV